MTDQFKIQEVIVNNFKKIDKVELEINGQSFFIIGKNAAAKSSLIQAMKSPMNVKELPSEPIQDGKERASIEMTLASDNNKYHILMEFTPSNKKGKLSVKREDGSKVSNPKTIIKELFGGVSFDIMSFLREPAKEQANKMLNLLSEENQKEFHKVKDEINDYVQKRRYLKERLNEQKGTLSSYDITEEEFSKYSEYMDKSSVQQEFDTLNRETTDYDRIKEGVETVLPTKIEQLEKAIVRNEKTVADLKRQLQEAEETLESNKLEKSQREEKMEQGRKWLSTRKRPSMESINSKLAEIDQHNKKVDKIKEYTQAAKKVNQFQEDIDKYNEHIKSLEKDKRKVIASADLPVPELVFDEEGVYIQEGDKLLPLSEKNVEKSRIIKIGGYLGRALNPNLKVCFISDASLFDEDTTKEVITWAHENDIQVIFEKVSESSVLEFNFIENEI